MLRAVALCQHDNESQVKLLSQILAGFLQKFSTAKRIGNKSFLSRSSSSAACLRLSGCVLVYACTNGAKVCGGELEVKGSS